MAQIMFCLCLCLTLRVSRVARLASGGLKSFGMLTLSVEIALRRVKGTGKMTISALPSLLIGMGLPAAHTDRLNLLCYGHCRDLHSAQEWRQSIKGDDGNPRHQCHGYVVPPPAAVVSDEHSCTA